MTKMSLSFPRRRESIASSGVAPLQALIPAFAGMTKLEHFMFCHVQSKNLDKLRDYAFYSAILCITWQPMILEPIRLTRGAHLLTALSMPTFSVGSLNRNNRTPPEFQGSES